MKLYIGNQNYSSWSLRAWLIFAQHDLQVEVQKLTLFSDQFYQQLELVTPTAKVPTLVDGERHIWDSLAILEYVSEQYLGGEGWPLDVANRAKARALACEMHSGFFALREQLPMNCRASRIVELDQAAEKDIARIDAIWSHQIDQFGEGWLFGDWSIADAMFAPVALRFLTYGITLTDKAAQYQKFVLASPALKLWLQQASSESDIVPEDEAGIERV